MVLDENNFHLVKEEIKQLLLLNDWTEDQLENDYGYNSVRDLAGIITDSVSFNSSKYVDDYKCYEYVFNLGEAKLIANVSYYIKDGSECSDMEIDQVEYIKN